MFESQNGDFDIQKSHINDVGEYVITAGLTNNGILGKTNISAKVINGGTITIDMFGNSFYRHFKYKMVTHARVFSLIPKFDMSKEQGLYIVNSFKYLIFEFGYENMCSWAKIQNIKIQLPIKNGKIDFEFMESFISELEEERISELSAYLTVSGLDNYELSSEEKEALESYNDIMFDEYKFKDIFNNIKQGRRLKKDDQIIGTIPFVMSGITNTGVVGYISNPVALFSKNSITIDIFGNSFYRNYDFGAGDDTGVYWNDEVQYSKETMLYFTAAMEKSLSGKYSYGKKLRSSQSYNFKIQLPTKNNEIDFSYMELLISAVQKLVIKDVVMWKDKKIEATKQLVGRN